MRSARRIDFCSGAALSLAAPVMLLGGGDDLIAIAFLAVLVVGLARVVKAALEAVRVRRNPLWRVLASGGAYWCGAAVASIAAWNVALAFVFPGLDLRVGLGDLRALWIAAAVSVAVVACVTSALHSLRSRP